MRTVHIKGNGCVSCHRAPMGVAELFEASDIQVNSFMPPHDPGSMANDYAALHACYKNGPEQTPGCDWVVPPGGGCEGGVVSTEYEGKSLLPGIIRSIVSSQTRANKACRDGDAVSKDDVAWVCEDGAWQAGE